MKRALLVIPAFLLLGTAVAADSKTNFVDLSIGDVAPAVKFGKWIQGEPIRDFDRDHVYILEFWATWCPPCRASIPHLNDLARKLESKGVIVIGQNVWDSDSAVAPFVRQMGEKMTYRVALDDKSTEPEGLMAASWWKRGVGNHGIPAAFIINRERRIVWIGDPMALTERLVTQVLSGTCDLSNASVEHATQKQIADRANTLNHEVPQAMEKRH